jgi:predicted HAD superfamily Cof-like phosphohydrolase
VFAAAIFWQGSAVARTPSGSSGTTRALSRAVARRRGRVTGAGSRGGRRQVLNPSQLVLDLDLKAAAGRSHMSTVRDRVAARIAAGDPVPGEAFHRSDVAKAVAAFHRAFGLPQRVLPDANVGEDLATLRLRLLSEEVGELRDASATGDIVGIADALADIVYVAYGTAVTYGLELDSVLAEVHRANMSKLDADGRPILRSDGKVLKSARYRPPDVAGVLAHQLPLIYG